MNHEEGSRIEGMKPTPISARGQSNSWRAHLAVSDVPDEKLPCLIASDCSGLAPLAGVHEVHHCRPHN